MMDYKSKYYRVLATLWIVVIIGGIFLWNIHSTLNNTHKEVVELEKRKDHELIQAYHDAGWLPYEKTEKRSTK